MKLFILPCSTSIVFIIQQIIKGNPALTEDCRPPIIDIMDEGSVRQSGGYPSWPKAGFIQLYDDKAVLYLKKFFSNFICH